MTVAWAVGAVILCGLLPGCPNGPERRPRLSRKLYYLGQDYYNKAFKAKNKQAKDRYVREAMSQLKKSVKYDPVNFLARNLLGYLYLHQADQELGLVEVAQCLKGEEAAQTRQDADKLFRMAQTQFKKVVKQEPKCTNAWLGLANISMHFAEYQKAIEFGRKVVNTLLMGSVKAGCSTRGDKAVAWGNIGWAFFHLGKLIKASKNLRQAVFLQPKFHLGRYWLGRVYYTLGRHEAARKELAAVVTKFGLPQAAFQYLALTLLKLKQREAARDVLQRCVKLAPASCTAQQCKKYLRSVERSLKGTEK